MPKITLEIDKTIRIYIKGILHLSIKTDKLVAIQSWAMSGMYCIEYTLTDGRVLCEYDTPKKWITILNLLNKHVVRY